MKQAISNNKRLILLAAMLLVAALIITLLPALQAEAQPSTQTCGKFGYVCYARSYYTCTYRRGRRSCGYLSVCVCYPVGGYRSYGYRGY